jgi:unsaturated rhamnogalacturonyl hydrolase
MLKLNYDEAELCDRIDKIVRKTMTMDLPWEWSCGVAYYGIARAYELTKNEEYINFLIKWTDEYLELGLPDFTVNTCAMGHVLITLYEATGNQKYWDLVMSEIEFLRNRALRFGDHVLQHTVSKGNDFPEQAWADTYSWLRFLCCGLAVS